MGKITDVFSKGISESDRKELKKALEDLSRLHAKLSAKYTLADNLEHITDGRTAAAKLIKSEIDALQGNIDELRTLKTKLEIEIKDLLDLREKVSHLKETIEVEYEDGSTTLQTLEELLDSNNVLELCSQATKLTSEYDKYFNIQDGEEDSLSQQINTLTNKSKEVYSYLFNNEVEFEGIETNREQILKKKYQEINQYYDQFFIDKITESGEKLLSIASKFDKQKNAFDKFYIKIFGDEKTSSLEDELNKRLKNLIDIEQQAVKTINQASSAGLAGGFFDKANQAKKNKENNLWVFGIALVLLALFNFTTINFENLDKISITSIIVRLILNIPLLWIATVANINLNKYSKLEQEYGHKEALARSFEKYKSEIITLNAESDETVYLKAKLLDLNLEAFRKNPADGMETARSDSFLERLIPNLNREKNEIENL